jgi:hypothetical protein
MVSFNPLNYISKNIFILFNLNIYFYIYILFYLLVAKQNFIHLLNISEANIKKKK